MHICIPDRWDQAAIVLEVNTMNVLMIHDLQSEWPQIRQELAKALGLLFYLYV